MTNATISVDKQNVKALLSGGAEKPFVVPEYQRPYAWTDDQIYTLFDDLKQFTLEEKDKNDDQERTYFLGSVVSYDKDGKQEIIDGQQRITSLFLLLRAIYTKLLSYPESEETVNFKNQIGPTLWKADKLTGKVDYKKTLISSKVINNSGNEILQNILETGKANPSSKDNYSRNYILFQSLFDELCEQQTFMVYDFIYNILNKCILLPIKADDQDTALNIFSTLNNRGMPLSDADIFKAQIYNKLNKDEKSDFIKKWQDLDEKAENVGESIQKLFYYYMFYLRAKKGDADTTTPGIRKYYVKSNPDSLYEESLLEKLGTILNLWVFLNNREKIEGEEWSDDTRVTKSLDILSSYPNEFWKYPVVVFYLSHKEEENFDDSFSDFLFELAITLCNRYIVVPTVSNIKGDVLKLDVEIVNNNHPTFNFKFIDNNDFEVKVISPNKNIVRMVLKFLAYSYENQEQLLPGKWEIEHILPQSWKPSYHVGNFTEEQVKEYIEHIGNKTLFEKKLNIMASNNYFSEKKKKYLESNVSLTRELGNLQKPEWRVEEILERDILLRIKLKSILLESANDYKTPFNKVANRVNGN